MENRKYKLYYYNQVLCLDTKKIFNSVEEIKTFIAFKRRFGTLQYVIVDCTETYNNKIIQIINDRTELK